MKISHISVTPVIHPTGVFPPYQLLGDPHYEERAIQRVSLQCKEDRLNLKRGILICFLVLIELQLLNCFSPI